MVGLPQEVGGSAYEVLPQPKVVNCYSDSGFVENASRVFLDTLCDTLLVTQGGEKCSDEAHWSGKYAVIGLSGGSTPREVYKVIGDALRTRTKFHSKMIFFMIDERYVPITDENSNTKMIKETLLAGNSEIKFLYPNTSLPLSECVAEYNQRLTEIFGMGRPSAVCLGLGPDGHLASWFPPMDAEDSFAAYDPFSLVTHIQQDRFAVPDRITVNMRLLASAKKKIFFLMGEEKIEIYKKIIGMRYTREAVRQQPLLQVMRSDDVTLVTCPPLVKDEVVELHSTWKENKECLSVVVLGASGDLAKKKTFPALFSLFCAGYLPQDFHITGYARSKMTVEALLDKLKPNLLSLDEHFSGHQDDDYLQKFQEHLGVHHCANYASVEDAKVLETKLAEFEAPFSKANRLFYLALPPDAFVGAVAALCQCCWSRTGWNRVIVEKPFGRDLDSAKALAKQLSTHIKEEEMYRIDHYLGKEMVLNLLVLRFANVFLEPIWNRHYIKSVRITWKEPVGTAGRGGYFDNYGIIRDVIQNHLLQIFSLVAMERPVTTHDEDVRDEKVKVLRCTQTAKLEDTVIGQYTASEDGTMEGYLDDPTVPRDSITPTFATTVLYVENERWFGVPFIIKAGKALESQTAEVRIQLTPVGGKIFQSKKTLPQNELVIRIQPEDAIYLKVIGKRPGLAEQLVETELDLSVLERLQVDRINDAYERLLLDVIRGDKKNFVRTDELLEAWRIFTPLLSKLEKKKIQPELYPAGSRGPTSAYQLIQKLGYVQPAGYQWHKSLRSPTSN